MFKNTNVGRNLNTFNKKKKKFVFKFGTLSFECTLHYLLILVLKKMDVQKEMEHSGMRLRLTNII